MVYTHCDHWTQTSKEQCCRPLVCSEHHGFILCTVSPTVLHSRHEWLLETVPAFNPELAWRFRPVLSRGRYHRRIGNKYKRAGTRSRSGSSSKAWPLPLFLHTLGVLGDFLLCVFCPSLASFITRGEMERALPFVLCSYPYLSAPSSTSVKSVHFMVFYCTSSRFHGLRPILSLLLLMSSCAYY